MERTQNRHILSILAVVVMLAAGAGVDDDDVDTGAPDTAAQALHDATVDEFEASAEDVGRTDPLRQNR